MTHHDMLKYIYNNHNYRIYTHGCTNDGKSIEYKNAKIISFIKFITRMLKYGPKDADDYIKDGYTDLVFITESLLNNEVENMESVKSIDEALKKVLNSDSGWFLYWDENDIFKYTIQQLYDKKSLDLKIWGW